MSGRERKMTMNETNKEQVLFFFEGGTKSAVPAVFVHGAGGSHRVWARQYSAFRDCCHSWFIDLPGHGKSVGQSADSISDYSQILAAFLAAHEIENPILVGHSMGSAIVMQLALAKPELRPRAIVIVGGGARLRVAPPIFDLLRHDFDKARKMIVKNLCSSPIDPILHQELDQDMLICGPEGMIRDFEACDRFDVMSDIGSVALPTLLLVGSMDVMTPAKYSRYLSEQISGSHLDIIDGAGHMVMLEQSDQFNTLLHRFLIKHVLSQ